MARKRASKAAAPIKAARVAVIKPRPVSASGAGPARGAEAARLKQGHQDVNGKG